VLRVRVLPRGRVPLRSALATLEICAALVVAHLLAGGALPSPVWLAVTALLVFGAGLLVLRGRLRLGVAVPVLVAAQLLLHAWLTALATDPVVASGGHAHGTAHPAETALDPLMLGLHVVGGLLTALSWHLRARAVDVVVTWLRAVLAPVSRPPRVPASVVVLVAPRWREVVAAAPRRGPPSALVAA
jgi:hypothetical protein